MCVRNSKWFLSIQEYVLDGGISDLYQSRNILHIYLAEIETYNLTQILVI